jgi:hypothetical protein
VSPPPVLPAPLPLLPPLDAGVAKSSLPPQELSKTTAPQTLTSVVPAAARRLFVITSSNMAREYLQ